MKRAHFPILAILFFATACSNREEYTIETDSYSYGDKNIAILNWSIVRNPPPMGHGSGKWLKTAYFPYIYSRSNGILKFERYCDPIKVKDPYDDAEQMRLKTIASVEKSCGVKDVSLISYDEAGRPRGGNNLKGGISVGANVRSPKTGKWEQQVLFIDKPNKPFWW